MKQPLWGKKEEEDDDDDVILPMSKQRPRKVQDDSKRSPTPQVCIKS